MLPPERREKIRRAFGVQVREHYGARECSSVAVQCSYGNRHISPRYIVEAVNQDDGQRCPPGGVGNLLLTDLFNDVTPFIRYEIGDTGAVEWRDCPCGARGPCITQLTGRIGKVIDLPSGRHASSHAFAYILREIPHIKRYMTIRVAAREFECHYIGQDVPKEALITAQQQLGRLLEGASIRWVAVHELDRSPSGKLIQYKDLTAE
jgi:phenylacetate-CoA ligase